MRKILSPLALAVVLGGLVGGPAPGASAGELVLDLGKSQGVTFVGALRRWDADGAPLKAVNPKALLPAPEVTARAVRQGSNRWVFRALPPGRYDLVILARGRVRVEGFHYPPVEEFDPFFPPTATAPEEAREWILKDIAKSAHYENKVTPLFLGGNDKQIRVLVQLVRDKPTSYDAEYGTPVATVRHEVWQYTYRYGSWAKERRTKILDRLLLPNKEFRLWTWVWEPRLGGIEVGKQSVTRTYELPRRFDPARARGWFPAR